jgi:glycosyltransferase involved in cell wall biosynthesis
MLAFIISDMLGQKAGCYLATSLLCQELAGLGLRVTCFAQNVDFGGEPVPGTFEIVRPIVRRGCRWDWPGRCLARQARRQIRAQDPAYVIVMGTGPFARYLLGSGVASRLLIWELTNATPGNKFVDPEAGRSLNRCRAVLSPSVAIDRGIREAYGYTGPILRLPFWIEDGQTPPHPQLSNRNSEPITDFIFLGRRDIEKGLHELVRATAQVAKEFPDVCVLVAGPGGAEPFAATARELGVTANIRFKFFRTRGEAMAALATSRCLVLPSYHEGYPLVLLEAIRVGVPVIATAVGSVPEVFIGSKAALIVPPKDVPSLAQAMRDILSQPPQHHEERRQAARELFRTLNSAEAIRMRLKFLLQQVREL